MASMNSEGILFADDVHSLEEVRALFVGKSINSVFYRDIVSEEYKIPRLKTIHQVHLSVGFIIGDTRVRVDWTQDDLAGGIAVSQVPELGHMEDAPWASMNLQEPWPKVLCSTIKQVGFGWHKSGTAVRCAWSIRLEFVNGESVVIALGHLGGEAPPNYHPDTLVVIFSKELAVKYEIEKGAAQAWGTLWTGGQRSSE